MRRYRPLPAVVFAIARLRAGRRIVRHERAGDRRQDSRTLPARSPRRSAPSRRLHRQGRVRQPRLRRRARDARTLDPHSSFFSPKEYAQLRERQEGRYYGLGITIQSVDGDITAMRVFEGSPAYKKGIRRGDIIAKDQRRGRQGVDQRAGDAQAARPEGHHGRHRPQAPRLRRADSPRSHPRREHHSERSGLTS